MNLKTNIVINTLCILLCLISLLELHFGLSIDRSVFTVLGISSFVFLIDNLKKLRRQKQLTDFLAERENKKRNED